MKFIKPSLAVKIFYFIIFFLILLPLSATDKRASLSPNEPEPARLGLAELQAQSYILYDFNSSSILQAKDIYSSRPAASMAKLMTIILSLEYLAENNIPAAAPVQVPAAGSFSQRPPGASLAYLREGQTYSWISLIEFTAVVSANDAAYALAELAAPSSADFIRMMNNKAFQLGMQNSYFADPDGWSAETVLSAYDMTLLIKYYIAKFPQALEKFHTAQELRLGNGRSKKNTNYLILENFPGIDGVKTGFTNEAGFNFAGSASRNNHRYIAIVMGIRNKDFQAGLRSRAQEVALLLEYAFQHYELVEISSLPQVPESLALSAEKLANLELNANIILSVKKDSDANLAYKIQFSYPQQELLLKAQSTGTSIGSLVVLDANNNRRSAEIRVRADAQLSRRQWWESLYRRFDLSPKSISYIGSLNPLEWKN